MIRWTRETTHIAAAWLLVGALGATEGLYGRTNYSGDAICYLNVARAISRSDWRAAFDPMWTLGYPALVVAMEKLFPSTPVGEWYAITFLNWLEFLGAYAAVRWLVAEAAASFGPQRTSEIRSPAVTWIACAVFLPYAMCFSACVSRVTPDLLVSGLFISGAAQTLRILRRRLLVDAVILGAILGLGCWTKGIFISYSAMFFLTLAVATRFRRMPWSLLVATAATCGLLALPYIVGISWSYGQFTLGVTGDLNYAFHVNHVPHWTQWLGGPPEFGEPTHHSELLVEGLPAFAFPTPFVSTYPPYNNMAYWYRGFRHFFSIGNQVAALEHTAYVFLVRIVWSHWLVKTFILVAIAIACTRSWRAPAWAALRTLWPVVLLSILAMIPFMLVHVEDRYVGSAFLMLTLLPLALLLDPDLAYRRRFLAGLAVLYTVAAAREIRSYEGVTLAAAARRQDFHNDRNWRMAAVLGAYGLKADDAVALIAEDDPPSRCTWAYLLHLRIVAEFGSPPWRIAPEDRFRLDGDTGEPGDANPGEIFWRLPEERRAQVIDAFKRVGARAVVSLFPPGPAQAPGWSPIADTGTWIYVFEPVPAAG